MSEQKDSRTEIGEIGEFGLIDRLSSKFSTKNSSTLKGIGDDAAVIGNGDDLRLYSTDMLLEGVHFDLSYMPLQHLGYKAVAVNVSDIAAMNGIPKQITISLALSNRFSVEAVEELYKGIHFACEDFSVDLVGGDTAASPSGLVISVGVIGEVTKDKVVYRKNAEENDIICVTGDLGGAFMGLQVLEREKAVFKANPEMQPELEKYDYIVKRQLKPTARMDVIHELRDLSLVPTAMIDISDGLASELFHIAKQSDVGITIYEDKLPISKMTYDMAVEFNMDPMTCALNGGEDYELLFTISQKDFEKIKNHADIAAIGFVNKKANGLNMITKNDNTVAIQAQGWKHF
ncbi:MAG: thiamine-phosphate kinase [Reichenbachiella sp.]|uniref:thiamine-phosphate kinase n=1 Tax=Reichenbachiella sp. TaxID=2184521 RepID=UPI003267E2B2